MCYTTIGMIEIYGLVWDDWNKEHIRKHRITIEEVEEVCHRKHTIKESYRKRIQLIGTTAKGKTIAIVLSPEDRNLRRYRKGMYYVVTAFRKEEHI